jgi:hypothetical protein
MNDQILAQVLGFRRAGVGPGYDRDAVPPRRPARDLAEEVGPGPAALGMRPVAVGEQEDVQRAIDRPKLLQQGPTVPSPRLPHVIAPRGLLAVLATAAMAAPASAHAQGAGDDQYQDPFASAPKTTKAPPAASNQRAQTQQPSLSNAPPAQSAPSRTQTRPAAPAQTQQAAPAAGSQLPYTGAEIPGMALLGAGLLAFGIGLRLRMLDDGVY